MIKKNIVKKKTCAARCEQHSVRKPKPGIEKLILNGRKESNKPKARVRSVDYKEYLFEQLQDQEFALGYLNTCIEDQDARVFLIAIKDVLMAQKGGMTEAAKDTNLNRQNLYKMLSDKGNPRWNSLKTIFDSLGFGLQLVPKKEIASKK